MSSLHMEVDPLQVSQREAHVMCYSRDTVNLSIYVMNLYFSQYLHLLCEMLQNKV